MHCPPRSARLHARTHGGYRVHDAEQADPRDKEEKHEEKCNLRSKKITDCVNDDWTQRRKKVEGAMTYTLSSLI